MKSSSLLLWTLALMAFLMVHLSAAQENLQVQGERGGGEEEVPLCTPSLPVDKCKTCECPRFHPCKLECTKKKAILAKIFIPKVTGIQLNNKNKPHALIGEDLVAKLTVRVKLPYKKPSVAATSEVQKFQVDYCLEFFRFQGGKKVTYELEQQLRQSKLVFSISGSGKLKIRLAENSATLTLDDNDKLDLYLKVNVLKSGLPRGSEGAGFMTECNTGFAKILVKEFFAKVNTYGSKKAVFFLDANRVKSFARLECCGPMTDTPRLESGGRGDSRHTARVEAGYEDSSEEEHEDVQLNTDSED